jgi:hypothetical protein
LCRCTSKFGISERLQGILCKLGQSVVFEEGSEILEELLGLNVSSKQIQRVSEYYGIAFEKLIRSNCEAVTPRLEQKDQDDPLYVMVDGSMICTRGEQRWREVKLGRIFLGSQVVDIQSNRREVARSIYVSHLGAADDSFAKFERHLVNYKRRIIIGDGAAWIWKWAEDNYPGAQQILDYYHAKEKLVILSRFQIPDESRRREWLKDKCEKLLNDKVDQVISALQICRPTSEQAREAKHKALTYYLEHEDRMLYKTYRNQGLLIGSGPVEAAHRSVLQQRIKLSGQRWSILGAQAIANLRCYKKSGAWNMVQKVIAAAA